MNKKTIKFKSADIINIRKNLDTEITKGWHTIRHENIMTTKEIKANLGSGKDLKTLYNSIRQMQQKRIKIKALLMYLNLGITTFDYEAFKATNNYAIFAATEAKEAITQLKMIPTINPTAKSKQTKSANGKKEIFTSAKIASLIKELQLEANKYDAAMENFNNNTEIEIADSDFITDITS
ncbi:hypothetical protein [Sharpea azabuensis]|uniref:hypothetical protein n=1 Tax=Sharpea azabuensis TaxID=322505 RepID=UPI001567C818|nr:hypothetical protein [Sharpea azabuensis]